MKQEIILGIAATSLLSAAAYAEPSRGETAASASSAPSHGGGKCASGKCGTDKMYSKAQVTQDPNGRLVQARDGKCGLSGKGYKVKVDEATRLAEGVCGS